MSFSQGVRLRLHLCCTQAHQHLSPSDHTRWPGQFRSAGDRRGQRPRSHCRASAPARSRRCDHLITEVCFSGRIIIIRSWSGRESGPKSVTSINDEHLPAERRSPLTHQTPLIARGSSAFGHCLLSADQRLAPSTELEEGLDQEGLRRRTKRISFHAPVHKPARNADRSCSSADRSCLDRLRKTSYAPRIARQRSPTRDTVRMQS